MLTTSQQRWKISKNYFEITNPHLDKVKTMPRKGMKFNKKTRKYETTLNTIDNNVGVAMPADTPVEVTVPIRMIRETTETIWSDGRTTTRIDNFPNRSR